MRMPILPGAVCSVAECGKPVLSKWFCRNHYRASRVFGDPLGFAGRTCKVCGKFFRASSCDLTCSAACRKVREKSAALRRSRTKRLGIQPPPERRCDDCGTMFLPARKNQACCSDACQVRRINRVRNAARRARVAEQRVEQVSPTTVFSRDDWRCYLCGVSTPRDLQGSNHLNAPSVDHVVPLSAGGSHSYSNCRCCCRSCNSHKGATYAKA